MALAIRQALPSLARAALPDPNEVFGAAESQPALPDISVVVPVCDERDNVAPLAEEIAVAFNGLCYEVVFVNDGSRDGTEHALRAVSRRFGDTVRVLRHSHNLGQSAAIRSGVAAARAAIIATIDGDGQNDPADLSAMIARWRQCAVSDARIGMIIGQRQQRRDTWRRRIASRIANRVRARLLADATPDTGCALKVFRRSDFLALPAFDHMHRFLPALITSRDQTVITVPVGHRRRRHGRSKYGIWDRLWVGIVDLFGVMWLQRRTLRAEHSED